MSLRVVVRPSAETDLIESAMFIAENDPVAAQRYLDEAEKAFARVAEFPEIGSPRTASDPSLAGLRLWPVPGFEKYPCLQKPRRLPTHRNASRHFRMQPPVIYA
jgi:plasmid stabilization system protein ParE